jgi:tRNA (guanine26-N2/guanine27-N2)-dimethyltransferase
VSVTATDTAALTGTIPRVTARRYHAAVSRSSITHEVGLRTLIGALVRDAARVDRELVPLLCHYADHYYRCYFRVRRNAIGADKALAMISKIEWEGRQIGPMWAGNICEKEMMGSLRYENWPDSLRLESPPQDRLHRLLGTLADETTVELDGLPVVGFYRVDNLAQETRTEPMSPDALVELLSSAGRTASRTHFDPGGVRTDATKEELLAVVRSKASPAAPKAR